MTTPCLTLLTAASVLFVGTAPAQEGAGDPASPEPFSYTRVHEDADGVSHYADASLAMELFDLGPGLPATPGSDRVAVSGFRTFCFADGTTVDWHPAPRRQYYFMLSGELELEVADGEVRRFGAGSVLLGEATEGQGVRARWSAAERACVAVMPLADPR